MPNTSKDDKGKMKKNIRVPDGKPEWKEGPQLPPEIVKQIEAQLAAKKKPTKKGKP